MKKDIIVFVNAIRPATFAALDLYEQETGRRFTPLVLVDTQIADSIAERNAQDKLPAEVMRVVADFDSPAQVRKALAPYIDRIFAVTSQYENSILELKKLVPYFPHLPMPTEKSLEWATEKKLMRELLEAHDRSLVPGYIEASNNSSSNTAREIERAISYPMMVKPSGLEGSLLVTRVDNRQELQETLGKTFNEMQNAYDKWIKRQTPTLLVEEFMEGDMYSVDTYVGADGACYNTPPVKVVTGRDIGFDDFFGYMRLAPAGLSSEEVVKAQETAEHACKALGLRALTVHVELMRTPSGWKVIELGPRIGGYRHDIYNLSYGINHIVNDVLNRAGEVPVIPAETLKHTAVFNIYAYEEGKLQSIDGIKRIKKLASVVTVSQAINVGEEVLFAKNNGDPVLVVMLSHESEEQLKADIKELEEAVKIHVISAEPTGTASQSLTDKYLSGPSLGDSLTPRHPHFL